MEQLSFDMKINNELKLEDILNLIKRKSQFYGIG